MGSTNGPRDPTQSTRQWLAITIVGLSIFVIAIVAGLAIGFADSDDRAETTRLVFTAMLPLLGTWVGTVLAFYFVRENLQAATDSTLRLTGRLEPQTPVQQVMIPSSSIAAYTLKANEDVQLLKLHDIQQLMVSSERSRIPILTSTGGAVYVIHESTLAQFASSKSKDPGNAGQFTELMSDLLAVPELKALVEAFGIVGPNAVLADARAAMRAVKGCNDVFVTTTGRKEDPVVGWLTNTDMAETQ